MKESGSGYLGNVIKDVDLNMESGCYEVKRQVPGSFRRIFGAQSDDQIGMNNECGPDRRASKRAS